MFRTIGKITAVIVAAVACVFSLSSFSPAADVVEDWVKGEGVFVDARTFVVSVPGLTASATVLVPAPENLSVITERAGSPGKVQALKSRGEQEAVAAVHKEAKVVKEKAEDLSVTMVRNKIREEKDANGIARHREKVIKVKLK